MQLLLISTKLLQLQPVIMFLSQAGHKDTPAADLVLRALEDSIYATFDDGTTFDDGIIYHEPTPFKF